MTDFEKVNRELGPMYENYYRSDQEIEWGFVSARCYSLSEEFIREFKDHLDWNWISIRQTLSESFIEEHKNLVDWRYISEYQKLSEEFIEKHKDWVCWCYISRAQDLSEPFIRKYKDRIDWREISGNQVLSEDFIERYWENLDIRLIPEHQLLSLEFIERHIRDLDPWSVLSCQPFIDLEPLMKKFQDHGINICYNNGNPMSELYQKTKDLGWFFADLRIRIDNFKRIYPYIYQDEDKSYKKYRIYWNDLLTPYRLKQKEYELIREVKYV